MSETLTKQERKTRKEELDYARKALELEKLRVELREAQADAEKAEDEARVKRIEREEYDRSEKERIATEGNRLEFFFGQAVDNTSVYTFKNWLNKRRRVDPGMPVTLSIYSPGGSVFAGFAMMDAMREAQENGTDITAKVTGYGASMAGFILQAAKVRLIGRDSYLMLHEISQGMLGSYKQSELEDEVDFCRRMSRRALEYYARRSDGKWTVEALEAKTKKLDWWLNADEAVENGFADGIF